jgi:hypothetical protein
LKTPIPVHLTYQTVFIDEAGQVQTRPDIYGLDKNVTALLRGEPAVAHIPVARNYAGERPVRAHAPSRHGYEVVEQPDPGSIRTSQVAEEVQAITTDMTDADHGSYLPALHQSCFWNEVFHLGIERASSPDSSFLPGRRFGRVSPTSMCLLAVCCIEATHIQRVMSYH